MRDFEYTPSQEGVLSIESEIPTSDQILNLEMRFSDEITSYHEMPNIRQAFTRDVAREIGERDNWTCQNTGKRFQDGWLVHMAHYNHTRDSTYNDPSRGRVLCIEEHLREHIELFKGLRNEWSLYALKSLASTAIEGLHTRQYYSRHPLSRRKDRGAVIRMFDEHELDIEQFLK